MVVYISNLKFKRGEKGVLGKSLGLAPSGLGDIERESLERDREESWVRSLQKPKWDRWDLVIGPTCPKSKRNPSTAKISTF